MMEIPFNQVALTFALVEVIKKVDAENKLNNWLPVFALGFGVAINVVFALMGDVNWVEAILMGLVYGSSASGFYSYQKNKE